MCGRPRASFPQKARHGMPSFLFRAVAMSEKLTHDYELCARGGRSRSALKMEAARNNLEKAKAALAAGFVGGRALARSFCSFPARLPPFCFVSRTLSSFVRSSSSSAPKSPKQPMLFCFCPGIPKPSQAMSSREIVRSRQEGIHAPSWSSPTSRLPGLAPMRSSAFLQAREKSHLMAALCCSHRRKVPEEAKFRLGRSLRR